MRKGKILINVNDIIGKRLGKLEVICYAGHSYSETAGGQKMRHYYLCKCDCGTLKVIQRDPLLFEIVHSCGCLKRKKSKEVKAYGNQNAK
jgi:hypothetical protein